MNDYLELYRNFKDVKDIADYIDEVEDLRFYYNTNQFQKMQTHINSITKKYYFEACVWNSINNHIATTYGQLYTSAENFMRAQGAKLIVEKVVDYKNNLSNEESRFIESLI